MKIDKCKVEDLVVVASQATFRFRNELGLLAQGCLAALGSPRGRANVAVGGGWGDVLKKFPIEGNFFSREGR